MSDTKALYDAFWAGFIDNHDWPSKWIGAPEKPVHSSAEKPKNYYDFDRRYGLGFRPTAALSVTKDTLTAQLSTGQAGRAFAINLQDNPEQSDLPDHLHYFIHINATDAKIELRWHEANLQARALWPCHYLWLRRSLELLASMLLDQIETFDSTSAFDRGRHD